MADLKPGMVLEGVVTNVAAFGAFVDVGVHQDGLVHVSAMSDKFVSDPHEVVRSGQVVKVKVLEVDTDRQRIGLTLRLNDEPGDSGKRGGRPGGNRPGGKPQGGQGQGGKAQGGQGQRGQGQRQSGAKRGGGAGRSDSGAAGGSMAQALRDAGFGR